jgi:hypothetical protein
MLLERDKTIERQVAGGQSHEYRFTLQAGQYARIRAEQRNINVAVASFAPGTGGAITSPDAIAIQVLALIPARS